MKILRIVVIILVIRAISLTMKRKKIDNRKENRKLKRRAAAILKKELSIGRAEYAKVMRTRERKTNSRLKKFRESIEER